MLADFTIVDLETTGLDPVSGRITELAARRYKEGKLCAAISVLVRSEVAPAPEAVALNGLTHEYLQTHGVAEWEAFEAFRQVLGSSVLVAHNAAFEMAWLNAACERWLEQEFRAPFLCTKTLAVELRAGSGISYSLKQLTNDYNIEWTGAAHRAMPDVVATKALLDVLCHSEQYFEQAGPLLGSLLNCCGVATGKDYGLPAGLPGHAREVRQ